MQSRIIDITGEEVFVSQRKDPPGWSTQTSHKDNSVIDALNRIYLKIINELQEKLIAGENITINGNVISATDTIYDDTALQNALAQEVLNRIAGDINLQNQIDSLLNGGKFRGAFATEGNLPANASFFAPITVLENDFATVVADSQHGGATTKYVITNIDSSGWLTWSYEFTYSVDISGKVDKVPSAPENNIFVFDNAGNAKDGGKSIAQLEQEISGHDSKGYGTLNISDGAGGWSNTSWDIWDGNLTNTSQKAINLMASSSYAVLDFFNLMITAWNAVQQSAHSARITAEQGFTKIINSDIVCGLSEGGLYFGLNEGNVMAQNRLNLIEFSGGDGGGFVGGFLRFRHQISTTRPTSELIDHLYYKITATGSETAERRGVWNSPNTTIDDIDSSQGVGLNDGYNRDKNFVTREYAYDKFALKSQAGGTQRFQSFISSKLFNVSYASGTGVINFGTGTINQFSGDVRLSVFEGICEFATSNITVLLYSTEAIAQGVRARMRRNGTPAGTQVVMANIGNNIYRATFTTVSYLAGDSISVEFDLIGIQAQRSYSCTINIRA